MIHCVAFCVMISCTLRGGYWRFGGTYCLNLQGRSDSSLASDWLQRSREEIMGHIGEKWLIRAMNREVEDGIKTGQ
jgi:hypothetical protein